MVLETSMYILCERWGRCSCEEECEEGAGCVLWTRDMVLDAESRDGAEVGEGSAIGGVDVV